MIVYGNILNKNKKKVYLNESKVAILNEFFNYKKPDSVYYSMDDKIELGEDPYAKLDKGKQNGKMRNFPIKRNGKEYWVARSSTVSLYVYCKNESGKWCVLASQRGQNVKFGGKWNVVSGFLDYGESLEEAAVRECYEECGINISKTKIIPCGVNSSKDKNGAVNHRFAVILKGDTSNYPPSVKNCEGYGTKEQEASSADWIPLDEMNRFSFPPTQIKSAKEIARDVFAANNSNKEVILQMLDKMLKNGEINTYQYNSIINILK